MNLDAERALVTVLILVIGFLGVMAPRCGAPDSPILVYLNLFSAGVLMSAALVHLLNESSEAIANSPLAQNAEGEPYPWNFFFAVLTFFVMFLFERFLIKLVAVYQFRQVKDTNGHGQISKEKIVTSQEAAAANIVALGRQDSDGEIDVEVGGQPIGEAPKSMVTSASSTSVVHDGHLTDLVEEGNYVGAFVLMAGLSLHSVLEGLALGDAQSTEALTTLVIAILCHKFLAAFALGMPFYNAGCSLKSHVLFAALFAIMTPIGALIGWGVGSHMDEWVSGLLISFAAGTFMYVAIMEILVPHFGAHNHGELWAKTVENVHEASSSELKEEACKGLAILLGFGAMSVLGIWA